MKADTPSLGTLLDELEAAGLVDATSRARVAAHLDSGEAKTATPLYLRLTIGLGAWLTGFCFLVVLGLGGIFDHRGAGGMLGGGMMGFAALVLRWREAGVFLRQLGFTMAVAGDLLLVFAAGDLAQGNLLGMALAQTVISLVAYPLLPSFGLRFALPLAAVAMVVAWCQEGGHQPFLHLLAALEWAMLLWLFRRGPRPALLEPLAAAVAVMLPATVVLIDLGGGLLGEWRRWLFGADLGPALSSLPTKVISAGALGWLAIRWSGRPAVWLIRQSWFLLVVVLMFGLAWLAMSGVLVALGLLALGFDEDAPVLSGLGWAFLALFLGLDYYALNTTLVVKSGLLAGTGTLATLGSWALRRREQRSFTEEPT